MAMIQVNGWQCDECGYIWLKVAGKIPTNCPNRKCRTRKWNSKLPEVVTVIPQALPPVKPESITIKPSKSSASIAAPGHHKNCCCNSCVWKRKYAK